jgi:hypothetical protein
VSAYAAVYRFGARLAQLLRFEPPASIVLNEQRRTLAQFGKLCLPCAHPYKRGLRCPHSRARLCKRGLRRPHARAPLQDSRGLLKARRFQRDRLLAFHRIRLRHIQPAPRRLGVLLLRRHRRRLLRRSLRHLRPALLLGETVGYARSIGTDQTLHRCALDLQVDVRGDAEKDESQEDRERNRGRKKVALKERGCRQTPFVGTPW